MKILFKESFLNRLENQIEYIALDSPSRARKFKRIKKIPQRPHSYRKSIYFEDETIRELIFKGYRIVFPPTEKTVEIFGFVKNQNEPKD